jgi:hypothetical protein
MEIQNCQRFNLPLACGGSESNRPHALLFFAHKTRQLTIENALLLNVMALAVNPSQ